MGTEPDHIALFGNPAYTPTVALQFPASTNGNRPAAQALATAEAIRRFTLKNTTYLALRLVDTVSFDIIYDMSTS